MRDKVLAWHFLPEDGCLAHLEKKTKVAVGNTYSCHGEIVLCENGMHGSECILDALQYALGPICCRVEISGDIVRGNDKLAGRRRRVLWMADATRILHEFACRCAEDALVMNPDPRSVAAIAAKRKWLSGEINDEELDAACDAACDAAWVAACDAACDAAWVAACDAAYYAAWVSACNAARAAEMAAEIAAERTAMRDKYNTWLTEMMEAAHA